MIGKGLSVTYCRCYCDVMTQNYGHLELLGLNLLLTMGPTRVYFSETSE